MALTDSRLTLYIGTHGTVSGFARQVRVGLDVPAPLYAKLDILPDENEQKSIALYSVLTSKNPSNSRRGNYRYPVGAGEY